MWTKIATAVTSIIPTNRRMCHHYHHHHQPASQQQRRTQNDVTVSQTSSSICAASSQPSGLMQCHVQMLKLNRYASVRHRGSSCRLLLVPASDEAAGWLAHCTCTGVTNSSTSCFESWRHQSHHTLNSFRNVKAGRSFDPLSFTQFRKF